MVNKADSKSTDSILKMLMDWYSIHKREMPWRGIKDPYVIWISEIILQQTRVEQGLPYFHKFMELFPSVQTLAEAHEDKVLKAWEGLGYYSRARNLHAAAKMIAHEMDGSFPNRYEALLILPGVGPYTAAAIASICFDESVPVVDGNVNRFISRLFAIEEEVDSSSGRKNILEALYKIMPEKSPGDFNQALMEFGSLLCRPDNPTCESCPFRFKCIALEKGLVSKLPRKKAKAKKKDRYLEFHVVLDGGHTYIRKRDKKSIWKGLYEFPYTEGGKGRLALSVGEPLSEYTVQHILSHQRIHGRFQVSKGSADDLRGLERVELKDLESYPMARITTRFLENVDLISLDEN